MHLDKEAKKISSKNKLVRVNGQYLNGVFFGKNELDIEKYYCFREQKYIHGTPREEDLKLYCKCGCFVGIKISETDWGNKSTD